MLKYETIIIIAIQRPLWVLLSIFVLHLVFLLLLVQFVFLLQRFTHTSLSLSLSRSLRHLYCLPGDILPHAALFCCLAQYY